MSKSGPKAFGLSMQGVKTRRTLKMPPNFSSLLLSQTAVRCVSCWTTFMCTLAEMSFQHCMPVSLAHAKIDPSVRPLFCEVRHQRDPFHASNIFWYFPALDINTVDGVDKSGFFTSGCEPVEISLAFGSQVYVGLSFLFGSTECF